MHSLIPTTPTKPTTWLLPNLLPQAELVLLDGPSGSGKTVLLAHIAATLSHQSNQPILALTSQNQRDLFIEHLANHHPNYHNLQGLVLPDITNNCTPVTEHILHFLKDTITQQKPQLLLIDSLEKFLAPVGHAVRASQSPPNQINPPPGESEIQTDGVPATSDDRISPLAPPGRVAGGEGDPTHGEAQPASPPLTHPASPPLAKGRSGGVDVPLAPRGENQPADLHHLWHSLRQLAHESNCTILITRSHGHHESRQYTPFTRYGSEATRYALTLLYHPHDTSIRVVTRAKNLRGPIGEQFHLFFAPNGITVLLQADFHLHVRPTRTPTTWIPSPRHLLEDQGIIELTESLMLGKPMQADDLLKELTKCYPLAAVRRALAQTRMPITLHNKRFYYLPTALMKDRALKAEMLRHPSPSRGEGLGVRGSLEAKPIMSAKPPENMARTHPSTENQLPTPVSKHLPPMQRRQAG